MSCLLPSSEATPAPQATALEPKSQSHIADPSKHLCINIAAVVSLGATHPPLTMALSPLLRWGSILSLIIAVALAVTLFQQQPLLSDSVGDTAITTHCYKRVRTHDNEKPSAQCFEVQNGQFTRVWSDEELPSGDSLRVETVDGYAIPGLWDGHGHLLLYGQFLHSVDLFGSKTLDEVRDRIKKYLDANPGAGTKNQWLLGVGWDQAAFGRMPTAVSDNLHLWKPYT